MWCKLTILLIEYLAIPVISFFDFCIQSECAFLFYMLVSFYCASQVQRMLYVCEVNVDLYSASFLMTFSYLQGHICYCNVF